MWRTGRMGRLFSHSPKLSLRPSCSGKPDVLPTHEDHQAQFYKDYQKIAEEYDKEFLKRYDEDLNTTLIFVSFASRLMNTRLLERQAGLFSAVASAFIIQVDSQVQPDPNEETAALLRVLIYKIDNTTFGNDVPTIPKWTGPPPSMVQVEAILFASLAISLLSAFLAMLGKQWLNRYDSTGMRGTAIERSQNRQQKLDGINAWYFNVVMESLPLMLQAALLLLGCALSRYLWGVNITIASVVLGVTSLGALFYLFIVIAATIHGSCPYQTPAAYIIRHILRRYLLPTLRSAISNSYFYRLLTTPWGEELLHKIDEGYKSLPEGLAKIPHRLYIYSVALFKDILRLGRGLCRLLITSGKSLACWFIHSLQGQQMFTLNSRCTSWILQTSLDKAIHLSTFRHLTEIPELSHFDPALILDCFNSVVSCINVSDDKVVIVRGLEELATLSTSFFLRILCQLAATDPTSSVLEDLRRRYSRIFPHKMDFTGSPFCSTMSKIHFFFNNDRNPQIQWDDNRPPAQELVPLAGLIAEAAWKGYRLASPAQTLPRRWKVPRWTLRFAHYSLSLDPLPPASVVVDCLKIIAKDLGCYPPYDTILNTRYEYSNFIPAIFLMKNQFTRGRSLEPHHPEAQKGGSSLQSIPYSTQAQGNLHTSPICNLPAAKRAVKAGCCNLGRCKSFAGDRVFGVPPRITHDKAVQRVEPSFPESGHCTPVTPYALV